MDGTGNLWYTNVMGYGRQAILSGGTACCPIAHVRWPELSSSGFCKLIFNTISKLVVKRTMEQGCGKNGLPWIRRPKKWAGYYMNRQAKKNQDPIINIPKMGAALIAIYILLIILFYWLAGAQLHFRQSRGNFTQPTAEAGTVELCQGAVVEQTFTVNIQRLQSISVQWGTYYRPNSGTVTMELYNLIDNSLVMSQSFDAAAITEGGLTTMSVDTPIETVYGVPLLLRVWADSPAGAAVSPLMSQSVREDGFSLTLNGVPTDGILCFSASGEDYIWTGLHYWEFAAGFGLLLALGIGLVWYRQKKGKHSYVVNALAAMQKYHFLIQQLVSRDFKTKYKRSILGIFWSFLNPLLTMCVQYFVFSTIFKSDVPNFAAYLIIGTVMFSFFSEACGMSLTSILGNAGLITKVYVPKYIYPLTRVMSSLVNLAISLIPMLIVCLMTGVELKKSAILAIYFMLCLVIFSLGFGLLLSTSMVFFRDTQFLWNVFNMMWMYATPVFYPETILAENFKIILQVNPLYHFLKNVRLCILDGISPEPFAYAQCFLIALVMLLIGAVVFRKNQDKFVLYL